VSDNKFAAICLGANLLCRRGLRFEYGMHGQVFKYTMEAENRVATYASFGGLLMCMRGDQRQLVDIELDSQIYVLIRRLA